MSYTMWPIHSIGFNILNENYIQAVIKDIENSVEITDEKQKELFSELKGVYEDLEEDKSSEFLIDAIASEWYDDYRLYDWYDNYIEIFPLGKDGKTTKIDSHLLSDDFFGIEFSFGSSCIFEPEFKNLEEFLNILKKEIYIPKDYDPFERGNIVCLLGVCGG